MGFLVGILTGFSASVQNTLVKKMPRVDTAALNGFRFGCTALVLAILVSIFASWNIPPLPFFFILLVSIPLELVVSFCYIKALQLSPQSLVGPLFSLSVIFLIPISFVVFGEAPSLVGWIGIIAGFLGSLLLGWDIKEPDVRKSLLAIFEEKGTHYMLIAALAAALTVTLAKFSFQYANPLVTGFYVLGGLSLAYLPSALKEIPPIFRTHWKNLIGLGLSNIAVNSLHFVGLSLMPSAYFISLKRSSILFDVFLGRFVHQETHFKERLAGSALMLTAIVLILLA